MSDSLRVSPRIKGCRWGHLDIEGQGGLKDAKLYPGGARAWDWAETGTRHDPGIQPADVAELLDRGARIVVLSTGVYQRLRVRAETLHLLERKGVACHVLPTADAVAAYNRLALAGQAVGALIHSTC